MLVLNLSTVAILWFGSIRIDNGEMQIGALIAFLQYAMQILFAMLMLSFLFILLPRAAASATRINAVLDMAPEINDASSLQHAGDRNGLRRFRGRHLQLSRRRGARASRTSRSARAPAR